MFSYDTQGKVRQSLFHFRSNVLEYTKQKMPLSKYLEAELYITVRLSEMIGIIHLTLAAVLVAVVLRF